MSDATANLMGRGLEAADAIALEFRRINVGVPLLDCASQLAATVNARTYDKLRRVAGPFRDVVERLSDYYGFTCDELEISITPVSVIANSLRGHDLVSLGHSMDSAASDVGVDTIRGFATVGNLIPHSGFAEVARSIPAVLASTQHVSASVDYVGVNDSIHHPTVAQYADIVLQLSELSSTTPSRFLRLSCGPACPRTHLYHPVGNAAVSVSIEVSCLSSLLSAFQNFGDVDEMCPELERAAFQSSRAARFISQKVCDVMSEKTGMIFRPGQVNTTARLVGSHPDRQVLTADLARLESTPGISFAIPVAMAALGRGAELAGLGDGASTNRSGVESSESGASRFSRIPLGDASGIAAVPVGATRDDILSIIISKGEAGEGHVSVVVFERGNAQSLLIPGVGYLAGSKRSESYQ